MICSYLVWKHPMELLFGQTEAFAVGAVHHQDDNLKDGDRSAPPRQLWSLSILLLIIFGHKAREVALEKRLSAPRCCSSMSTSWLGGSPARRYPKLKSASCARWSARRCFRWWATCGRLLSSGCQQQNIKASSGTNSDFHNFRGQLTTDTGWLSFQHCPNPQWRLCALKERETHKGFRLAGVIVPAIWNCIIGQKNAEIRQTECYITAYNVGFMIVTLSF